ncbi:MAG TPA: MarR family transcriptional regulator, partial [Actinospica sp.]|nr:MarR family transcriptional regulator [Actinospica sp.]
MSDEKLHSWFKTEETYAGAAQLPPGSASLAGLAEALEVNPSTALRMVERLTTAGMVEKAANPARRREVLLRLT